MKVLVACEESQRVCTEFRKLGHEAYSCDIIECSGGHPEWHIKGDVLEVLNGNCSFKTENGDEHFLNEPWDMIIAHPPCTYLSNACTRGFSLKRNTPEYVIDRWEKRAKAAVFFMRFVAADAKYKCIENPVGFMTNAYRKPDQYIDPYMFCDSTDSEDYVTKKPVCGCLIFQNLKEQTTSQNRHMRNTFLHTPVDISQRIGVPITQKALQKLEVKLSKASPKQWQTSGVKNYEINILH